MGKGAAGWEAVAGTGFAAIPGELTSSLNMF